MRQQERIKRLRVMQDALLRVSDDLLSMGNASCAVALRVFVERHVAGTAMHDAEDGAPVAEGVLRARRRRLRRAKRAAKPRAWERAVEEHERSEVA